MTKKQQAAHAALVKQVHTSIRYQNFYRDDRDAYVQLLQGHFDKSSSKDLTVGELIMLVDYLNMRRSSLPPFTTKTATAAQLFKMEQGWSVKARDKSTAALLSFVKRITGNARNALNELSKDEARKVIIAIERM